MKFLARILKPTTSRAVITLGCLAIAVVIGMTGYEIWRQRTSTVESAERNLRALSLALAHQTERAFHSVQLVVDATAVSVMHGGVPLWDQSAEFHHVLRARIAGTPQIIGLAVVDREGHLVNGAMMHPPAKLEYAEREEFLHHRASPSPALFIGTPRPSPADGSPFIPVSRRLSGADGSFQGIIVAAVDPDYFQQFYSRVLPAEGGAFAMFRSDGTLLARSPANTLAIGKKFSHLAIFKPEAPAHGLGWGPSPMDGAYRILAYNKLSLFPLTINVSLKEDVLLAAWRENAARLVLGAVAAAVVLSAAVTLLARQTRREEAHARALKDSEKRLRFSQFALDHAADMVFWLDADAHVLYANQAAAIRLGYDHDDLVGKPISEVDRHFTTRNWHGHLRRLKRKRYWRFESAHRTHDGEDFPVEVSVNYVAFAGGDFVCAFVRDISDRKGAEAALAEKTARLEASNAELEQFAYVASHDLREPLRMVNSFVTMLERRYADKLDDEGREFIGFAREGAVRMDRLILDLLEYSRVGRIDRPLTPLLLGQTIDLAIKGLGVAIDESSARIEVSDDLPLVMANEEEITRLYLNLIGNALKYHHPDRHPVVRVGARRQGGEIICWVSDNGIGIAPQYFERIFRIFQRLHGRGRYDGTGIGLAICKKIVERHGGRIWIDSTPDQGATFFFTLKAG